MKQEPKETIKGKSVRDRKKFSIRSDSSWMSSSSPSNELSRTFWRVVSSVRLSTFLLYKKLEWLFGTITESDMQMLIDSPGFFSDNVFLDALRALSNKVTDKETLAEDMAVLFEMGIIQTNYSPNLLYTLRGVVQSQITLETVSIRQAKKFSGYVRNSSSVGSKRKGTLSIPEPEISEWTNPSVFDFYHFFSVGEFSTGQPGATKLILTRSGRPKRKNPKRKYDND